METADLDVGLLGINNSTVGVGGSYNGLYKANNLVKILIGLGGVVGRAFTRALRQEINASQQAAKARASAGGRNVNKSAAADSMSGLSLQEAKQILNLEDISDDTKVQSNYDHLFNVNEKSKGGSFYLQSKVVRAKERIDEELRLLEEQEQKKKERQEAG